MVLSFRVVMDLKLAIYTQWRLSTRLGTRTEESSVIASSALFYMGACAINVIQCIKHTGPRLESLSSDARTRKKLT